MAHLQVVNEVLYRPLDLSCLLDPSFVSTCIGIRRNRLILAQLSTEAELVIFFGTGVHKLMFPPDKFQSLSDLRILGSVRTGALRLALQKTALRGVTVTELETEGSFQLTFHGHDERKELCHSGTGTVIL